MLAEPELFPWREDPQVTFAVLLPPTVDSLLFRALTATERHDFTVRAAIIAGGMQEQTARLLFAQEVADGHLSAGDWEAFRESVGCAATAADDMDDNKFRCLWLILVRHQAVKRFAQLCGHGDPTVNERHCRACLRVGRGPVQNGIRCATSPASASDILGVLTVDLEPWLRPATEASAETTRCLGVEETGGRAAECAPVILAFGPEAGAATILGELHDALTKEGLTLIGLRLLPWIREEDTATSAALGGPEAAVAVAAQWRQWLELRPAASKLRECLAAYSGSFLLVAACEGPQAIARSRVALGALTKKVANAKCGQAVEWYLAASAGDAATDVAHFFHDLYGGHHYIVGP